MAGSKSPMLVGKVAAKSRPKKKPEDVAHDSGSDDYYYESDGSEVDRLLFDGPACAAATASDPTGPRTTVRRFVSRALPSRATSWTVSEQIGAPPSGA